MVMCLTGLRGEDVKPRSSQGLGARGLALHLRTGGRVPHIPGVEHWPSLPCPGSYAFDTVCQGRGLRQERTAWMAWRSAGGKVSRLPQVETCPGPRPAGEMQGLRWQALSGARAPPLAALGLHGGLSQPLLLTRPVWGKVWAVLPRGSTGVSARAREF